MASFKLTISDVKGKSITKELKDEEVNQLIGLKVGSDFDASVVGLEGKLKITGGSDKAGIPLREDIHGGARKYVLITKGVGLKQVEKGQRARKLLRGNTISEEVYQINCKFDGTLPEPKQEEPEAQQEEKKE
ncbi:MAG: 30S ribosomal protein S6e [Nitrosopumilaceae archaeon]|nr:30S ribosomal protein S6e [Nitrosopumilaceae archaeon]NIU00272.1 30S ribosomal protein S6e [Nitrosopumilaceae archaeon]NIU86684.1 30S ribosomal protein S6e [Nitrosopumilaceae archaeon]NIV65379.1 30S ribosomal protein S6e [Nitrosopumilaceae archaeon]NIX60874.1 30S ribosomal protein S6e [Nitrosopumilaceae archaeon]